MRKTHFLIAGLFILGIILFARLIWIASHTETGWLLLKRQWLDATAGMFKGEQIPISRQEPIAQADFWLKEVNRITDADPDNAQLAMGAAIVLDSPGLGFVYRYSTIPRQPGFTGVSPQIDSNEVNLAMNLFENKCKEQCLKMAARATELQPEDVRWWRLRALLLLSGNLYGSKNQVRDPDWLSILDQCIKQDPDNALYAYLAAWELWNECVEYEYSPTTTNVKITDPQKNKQAFRYFQSGQKKSRFIIDDDISSISNYFLQRSAISDLDFPCIINKEIQNKTYFILIDLWRKLNNQDEEAEQNYDFLGLLIRVRQQLRMFEQCKESRAFLDYEFQLKLLLSATFNKFRTLAEDNPEFVSDDEFLKMESAFEIDSFNKTVLAETSKRMAARLNKISLNVGLLFLYSLFVRIAFPTVLILLVAGVCAWLKGRFINWKCEKPPGFMGWFRNSIVWLGGYSLTFLIMGLTAAGILSLEIQAQVGSLILLLFGVFVINLLFWRAIYRRKIPYVVKTSMMLTLVLAVFIGILEIYYFKLINLHYTMNILPDPWYGNTELFMSVIRSQAGVFHWGLLQWFYHAGPYFSIAFALVMLSCWYQLRFGRKTSDAARGWRSRWGGMFDSLSRSMMAAAIIWLFIYLLLMPSLIRTYEDQYQYTMSFVRTPGKYAELLEKTVDEVKKDWSWMDKPQSQDQELQ